MLRQCFYYILWISCLVFLHACSRHTEKEAQGYIEGRYTYVASSVSGVITQLLVSRGAYVKQGQLLVTLEAEPESDDYLRALANLNQTIAEREAIIAKLSFSKITYERNKILVQKKAIQQSELDDAKSKYETQRAELIKAEAAIAANRASLAAATWIKNQKNITSPVNALVFDIFYRLGEGTTANQAIMSLLAPGNIKAIFYINETSLSRIQLRDNILVHCDQCQKAYEGKISFISPSAEYTPPVIYSNDTNEKLVFRIEAEFAEKDAINLHPGQPIDVTYDTHER